MINVDVHKLEFRKGLLAVLTVVSLLLPGFWFFYRFSYKEFVQLDLFRVLLISLAASVPIYILNFYSAFGSKNAKHSRLIIDSGKVRWVTTNSTTEEALRLAAIDASLNLVRILYLPTLISYGYALSLGGAIKAALIIQIWILVKNLIKSLVPIFPQTMVIAEYWKSKGSLRKANPEWGAVLNSQTTTSLLETSET